MHDPVNWDESLLARYSADMRQFVGARDITLNGMRALHLYNAAGLELIVLPDRGFDIWDARFKGLPLTWLAPGSPFPPDWGADWLRQFNGGLLTTCGLTHVGPPEIDDLTGEKSGIHGNYTRLRAGNYAVDPAWEFSQPEDEVNYYELRYSATIRDTSLFGPQLTLKRTYYLSLQNADIGIRDYITNVGDSPAPLMLLYHFNLGFPLVREGVKLHSSGNVYPRDAAARAGLDVSEEYSAPTANYREQVFYHHLRVENSEAKHAHILIGDDSLALHLMWDTDTLPYFTQWKNTRQRQYVNGIEPGNCIPEGRNSARKSGRLKMLEPGESVGTYLCLTVLDTAEQIAVCRDRIESLTADGQPIPACKLDDFAPYKE